MSPLSRHRTASRARRFIIASAIAVPFLSPARWPTTESCTCTWKRCPVRGSDCPIEGKAFALLGTLAVPNPRHNAGLHASPDPRQRLILWTPSIDDPNSTTAFTHRFLLPGTSKTHTRVLDKHVQDDPANMSKLTNKIEAHNRTASEVLENKKYTVDYFQREYNWQKRHIEQLITYISQFIADAFPGRSPSELTKAIEKMLASNSIDSRLIATKAA